MYDSRSTSLLEEGWNLILDFMVFQKPRLRKKHDWSTIQHCKGKIKPVTQVKWSFSRYWGLKNVLITWETLNDECMMSSTMSLQYILLLPRIVSNIEGNCEKQDHIRAPGNAAVDRENLHSGIQCCYSKSSLCVLTVEWVEYKLRISSRD